MTWANARHDAEQVMAALPATVAVKGTRVPLAWYESQTDLDLTQPDNTWPVSYHQMVTRAVQRTLLKQGAKVHLVTVTAGAFRDWLGDRANTPDHRAEYLAAQVEEAAAAQ